MRITLNGQEMEAHDGETILELCRREGVPIPTFCYHPAFGGQGACRMCMVELKEEGQEHSRLVASCTYPLNHPVHIITESERLKKVRRNIVMLLNRRADGTPLMEQMTKRYAVPALSPLITEPPNCILCGLCIYACEKMGTSAIWRMFRGVDKRIATPYDEASEDCIGCAACAQVCPTQAISVKEEEGIRTIWGKSFSMAACERCGKYYAAQEQIEYLNERSGQSLPQLCESCRKKTLAASIKSFQN